MKRKRIVNYVKSRNKKLFEYRVGNFQIFIKDPLPDNIDVKRVFSELQFSIPEHILKLIDTVYVGDFSYFEDRKINAMFMDGALYLASSQDNNEDMKDDVIHELAHAVEEEYGDFLYEDEEIKNEYIGKLKKLKHFLRYEGYDVRDIDFFNTEYDKKFDNFLFNGVGYKKLSALTNGLFIDPYSCISLREYFATCFEKYFTQTKHSLLKSMCPYVYKKLSLLFNENSKDEEYEYKI